MKSFKGRVGLIQRVLPNYRAPFFNALGRACQGGLGVFAGDARPSEMIATVEGLSDAKLTMGENLHLFRGRLYLCYQRGLMDWLKAWDPDVLIVEANPRYLSTPAAMRWMRARHRPVIGWGLGAPPLAGLGAVCRQRRRAAFLKELDAILAYSQKGAQEYAKWGFPPERIFVAANAVASALSHPLPVRPPLKSGAAARALFVGRLQARKQAANLIRACALLPADIQPELVIVGDGPQRAALEALAEEVYPQTVFTGALYGDALSAQFRATDLFVLPGTGGLAIQQAMSHGLPIIAAEADGTQSDLVRPENGWQVPADDVQSLSNALKDALDDPVRLRAMGAESYRIVAEEINIENMVAVFVQALNWSRQL